VTIDFIYMDWILPPTWSAVYLPCSVFALYIFDFGPCKCCCSYCVVCFHSLMNSVRPFAIFNLLPSIVSQWHGSCLLVIYHGRRCNLIGKLASNAWAPTVKRSRLMELFIARMKSNIHFSGPFKVIFLFSDFICSFYVT